MKTSARIGAGIAAAVLAGGAALGHAGGAPDGNGGGGMAEALAKGLAEKLDLDEATVLAALQQAMGSAGTGPTAGATG